MAKNNGGSISVKRHVIAWRHQYRSRSKSKSLTHGGGKRRNKRNGILMLRIWRMAIFTPAAAWRISNERHQAGGMATLAYQAKKPENGVAAAGEKHQSSWRLAAA